PPHKSKPSACFMFPIFLLDLNDDEGGMLVAAHTKEVMSLGEEDDGGFCAPACLQKNKFASKPLYQEMQDTLTVMFGKKCWTKLDGALRNRA
ncbi:TPA: hypothetical protein DDW35_08140, partial [Candidatus Sumerlaeota bacterium]|nr:hypothetical protein [Candidatus Sumerlaeota bacterium]